MVFHLVGVRLLNNSEINVNLCVSQRALSRGRVQFTCWPYSYVHVTRQLPYFAQIRIFFTVYVAVAWPDIRYVTDLEPHTNVAQM